MPPKVYVVEAVFTAAGDVSQFDRTRQAEIAAAIAPVAEVAVDAITEKVSQTRLPKRPKRRLYLTGEEEEPTSTTPDVVDEVVISSSSEAEAIAICKRMKPYLGSAAQLTKLLSPAQVRVKAIESSSALGERVATHEGETLDTLEGSCAVVETTPVSKCGVPTSVPPGVQQAEQMQI